MPVAGRVAPKLTTAQWTSNLTSIKRASHPFLLARSRLLRTRAQFEDSRSCAAASSHPSIRGRDELPPYPSLTDLGQPVTCQQTSSASRAESSHLHAKAREQTSCSPTHLPAPASGVVGCRPHGLLGATRRRGRARRPPPVARVAGVAAAVGRFGAAVGEIPGGRIGRSTHGDTTHGHSCSFGQRKEAQCELEQFASLT